MELNIQKSHVVGSEAVREFGFTIKADPKAFHLLIAQLYKDRISAFIRELSTNAYEAHQMLGIENQPFEVTLPSFLNPSFKIRDFGPGLSLEQVGEVYTTIFESTKTGSNEFGGCFGLGSKSPFAYSDNFGIISYNGGMKYCFAVFKDEEGYPKMNLLSQEPSNEKTGVEISIPIQRNDYSTVEHKAREIYKWFITPPKCVGGRSFDRIAPQTKGSNFGHYGSHQVRKASARMGNILYQIDANLCNLHGLDSYPIVVEFPIGALTPEPSREGLSFDKKTKRAIEEAFQTIKKEFIDKIQPKVDLAKDYYDAVLVARELIQNSPVSLHELKFKNDRLDDNLGHLDLKVGEVKQIVSNKLKKGYQHHISVQRDVIFIFLDKKCAYKQIIKQHVATNNLHRHKIYVCDTAYQGHKKEDFLKFFKIDESRLSVISKLPYVAPPRQASSKRNKHLTKMFIWKNNQNNANSWTDVDLDIKTDKGMFVVYYNNKILIGTREISPFKLDALLRLIGYTGTVYGVKKDVVEKVEKTGNWTNFLDYAKPLAYNAMQAANVEDAEKASKVINNLRYTRHTSHSFIDSLNHLNGKVKTPITQQDVLNALNEYKRVKQLSTLDYRVMAQIASEFYGDSLAKVSGKSTLDERKYGNLLKVIDNKFPLVSKVDDYDDTTVEELLHYISLKGI